MVIHAPSRVDVVCWLLVSVVSPLFWGCERNPRTTAEEAPEPVTDLGIEPRLAPSEVHPGWVLVWTREEETHRREYKFLSLNGSKQSFDIDPVTLTAYPFDMGRKLMLQNSGVGKPLISHDVRTGRPEGLGWTIEGHLLGVSNDGGSGLFLDSHHKSQGMTYHVLNLQSGKGAGTIHAGADLCVLPLGDIHPEGVESLFPCAPCECADCAADLCRLRIDGHEGTVVRSAPPHYMSVSYSQDGRVALSVGMVDGDRLDPDTKPPIELVVLPSDDLGADPVLLRSNAVQARFSLVSRHMAYLVLDPTCTGPDCTTSLVVADLEARNEKVVHTSSDLARLPPRPFSLDGKWIVFSVPEPRGTSPATDFSTHACLVDGRACRALGDGYALGWVVDTRGEKALEAFRSRKIHRRLDEALLSGIPDDQLEQVVWDYIVTKLEGRLEQEREVIDSLSPGLRALYATWKMDAEVGNGGYNQFFWTSSLEWAQVALEGYTLFGANENAKFTKKAISIYVAEKSLHEKYLALGTLEAFSESYEHTKLRDLTRQLFTVDEDTSALRVAYIRSHLSEFTGD